MNRWMSRWKADPGYAFGRRALRCASQPKLVAMLGILMIVVWPDVTCSRAADAEPPALYAAASLTTVITELFDEESSGGEPQARLSFASSATLARQIASGAPADLYISANVLWMDYLDERRLLAAGTRENLLGNSLVLIAPETEEIAVQMDPSFDLATSFPGRLALGDPDHVPAGQYARQALEHMGWWPAVEDRLAPAADVRAALMYVARGQCSMGVVYATDAAISDAVKVLAHFPAGAHDRIIYPVAAVRGRHGDRTKALIGYLKSEAAAAVFRRHGFTVLGSTPAAGDTVLTK